MSKVKEPKFEKQLICFDKEAFEKHNAEGRQKIVLLAQAVEFMSRHIKRVNAKKAVEVGFEIYFLDQLVQQNKKFKEMGINNPVKVLDLLDISVFELIRIEEWTYNFGSTRFIRFLRFENGLLRNISRGGYGY